jgi:hypothetical protein
MSLAIASRVSAAQRASMRGSILRTILAKAAVTLRRDHRRKDCGGYRFHVILHIL